MHSVLNLNIVRHWLTVHFMCFHRTLNASHSNARHWRMWATTAKKAAAKTNGFLICPCKKAERVAMLDAMKGWTSHSLRMKANGLQPPLTAVMRRCCERKWSSWDCAHGTGTFRPAPSACRVLRGGESGSGGSSCGNMNCERLPDGASGAGEIARGRRGRAMGWNATSVRHYRCLRDEHCQMPSEWSVYVPDFSDHELQWHLCQATSGLQSLVLMHWERQCLWNEMNSVELLRLIYASYFQ